MCVCEFIHSLLTEEDFVLSEVSRAFFCSPPLTVAKKREGVSHMHSTYAVCMWLVCVFFKCVTLRMCTSSYCKVAAAAAAEESRVIAEA